MKKLLTILLVFVSGWCAGQEFTFQLLIEDAIGNKDSITLGYDVNATEGVDSVFNETDITDVPIDTLLDARAVSVYGTNHQFKYSITQKAQQLVCFYSSDVFFISTTYWPVKISWDSTLFTPLCLNYIRLSNNEIAINEDYSCWGDMQYTDLRSQSSIIFTTATPFDGLCWSTLENIPDSARFCFVIFTNGLSVPEINSANITLYPNPASTTLTIESTVHSPQTIVAIYNTQGALVYQSLIHQITKSQIDISQLTPGLYYLTLQSEEGVACKKFEVIRY